MIVTFLGTGTSQGVPVIACDCAICGSLDFRDKRLRSSVHIEVKGKSLVIDTGPDFRQQMFNANIRRLDAILYTHAHKDHTAGMDDIRSYNFKQKCDMPIYAESEVVAQLKREFGYVFAEKKYPGTPSVEVHEINDKPFDVGDIHIIPIRVMHHKLPVLGFRIGDFTYITDANSIDAAEKEKIKGSKVLVLNALQKEPHLSHFTLSEALSVIEELQPQQAYLTHISHRLGLHERVSNQLPKNVALAFDGLQIQTG